MNNKSIPYEKLIIYLILLLQSPVFAGDAAPTPQRIISLAPSMTEDLRARPGRPACRIKGALMLSLDESTYLHFEGRSVKNYVKPADPEWKYSVFDAKLGQRLSRGKGEICLSRQHRR